LIPVLLLDRHRRLVKTIAFGMRTYVGDPFNVLRIFNEKEVDEIVVLDIDASIDGREPDFGFVRALASECFMPMGYGGAVKSVQHAEKLYSSGVEKLVIGSAAANTSVVADIAREFGSQSVTVCIDVSLRGQGWGVRTRAGQLDVGSDPVTYAKAMADLGAGEIILQCIDRDGVRGGYALDLLNQVCSSVRIPVIALGGAGTVEHLRDGLLAGASAVASGSAFVFLGRLRAVLITYPTSFEMEQLLAQTAACSA
jgi:cyclase